MSRIFSIIENRERLADKGRFNEPTDYQMHIDRLRAMDFLVDELEHIYEMLARIVDGGVEVHGR